MSGRRARDTVECAAVDLAEHRKKAIPAVSQHSTNAHTQVGPKEFGPNEWLVDELYQQFIADKNAVDPAWWEFFADYQPFDVTQPRAPHNGESAEPAAGAAAAVPPAGGPPPAGGGVRPAASAQPAPPTAAGPSRPPAPVPATPSATPAPTAGQVGAARLPRDASATAVPRPASGENDVVRLKGPAARVVVNMEASLEVPTATSVRAVPAKLMIDNRIVINNHLSRARGGKVSFTHLIGFALVEALAQLPEMNDSFAPTPTASPPWSARARQPRHRHRPAQARRHPPAAGAQHQALPRRWTSPSSGPPTRTSSGEPATASSPPTTSPAPRSA